MDKPVNGTKMSRIAIKNSFKNIKKQRSFESGVYRFSTFILQPVQENPEPHFLKPAFLKKNLQTGCLTVKIHTDDKSF